MVKIVGTDEPIIRWDLQTGDVTGPLELADSEDEDWCPACDAITTYDVQQNCMTCGREWGSSV